MLLLGLLHDIIEMNPILTLEKVRSLFGLSLADTKTLYVLTAKEGESSKAHYQRVVQSKDRNAWLVKYCDNQDNSVFLPEDYTFTNVKVGKDPEEEIKKYL